MTDSRESLSFKSQKRYALISAFLLILIAGLAIGLLTKKDSREPQELSAANLDKALEKQRTPWYSAEDKEYVYLPIFRQEVKYDPGDPSKNPFWEKLFTIILPAVFFTIVFGVLLWITIRKIREKSAFKRLRLDEIACRQRRLETLAEEAKSRYDDLQGAALEAYNAGDLRGAIIFYFSWILVEADKRELIWLDKGKTNLEYWRELDGNPEVQRFYRVIMDEFELVYYGGRSISKREFEELLGNRTYFEDLMRVEDERTESREREVEEIKLRNNAKKWTAPKFRMVLALIACSTFLLAGCKDKRWRDFYGNDTNLASHYGLNSLSAFCEYCRLTSKEKVYALDRVGVAKETFPFSRGDYDDCNTVVWLMCVNWRNGSWKLPFPVASELQDEQDDVQDSYEADLFEDEGRFSKNLDVWRKTLEAYANAEPEDWPLFYVPESSAALDGFSYFLNPVFVGSYQTNTPRESIETWLREKPGRKVVIVLASSNSTLDYWIKIRDWANERLDEPLKSDVLNDCREIFSRYDGVDFEKDYSPRGDEKDVIILPRCMASNILNASLMLTILDAAPDLIETPKDLTDALRRDKLDLTEEFEERFEFQYGSTRLFDLKASMQKLVDDYNQSKYGGPSYNVANGNIFRSDGSSFGYKQPCYPLFGDDEEEDRWFVQRHLASRGGENERNFSGLTSWTSCLPESAPFRERLRLIPGEGTETLLLHGDFPIVCRRTEGKGEILFVNSASFMTNFAMTEEVGRAFARRLTQEFLENGSIGFTFSPFEYPPPKHSAFSYEPPKLDNRFSVAQRSVFTEFVWRLTLLGTIVFFCFWPIFGRPRRLGESKSSDFSLHLDAYARLLKRVNSTQWAHDQLDKFVRKRRDEGKEEFDKKTPDD